MAYKYLKKETSRAKRTPGKTYIAKGKKPKLGTGKRFVALKSALKKKGARTPGALAAWIGRRKYGPKRFAALSAAARKKK